MTNMIQSNIQVNAADVSNAIFAELQKKLINKLNTLKQESTTIYKEATDLSTVYISACQKIIEERECSVLDELCYLINLRSKKKINWHIGYGAHHFRDSPGTNYLWASNFNVPTSYRTQFICTPATFYTTLCWDSDNGDDEEEGLDYFNLAGLIISNDHGNNEKLTCGEDETFVEFKKQLDTIYDRYSAVVTQIQEVEGIMNGRVDPRTGLTLKDYIAASIATKAIAQIPELASALNIDNICVDIDKKLISG